jgi:flagellar biosynthesis protein FlhF
MQLRTFRARTLPEAMRRLRAELGEDAVIVASRELDEGVQVTAAEPTAAVEDDLAALLAPAEASSARAELASALAYHNVPPALRATLEAEIGRVEPGDAPAMLTATLARCLRFDPLALPVGRTVALVGPAGAGKTAAVARLAAAARLAGQKVAVLCADTARAAALDQLSALLAPLGLKPESVTHPSVLAARSSAADTLTLVDTMGVNPFRGAEMAELARWTAPADLEPVLVVPAGADAQDTVEAVGLFAAVGVRRCIVTRLDASRRLGSVVAAGATGIGLGEASVSPLIGKAMPPLTAAGLARLLLRPRNRSGG